MTLPYTHVLASVVFQLTYRGRVTHISVRNLTIIGSDNGLSPDQRQAFIWTNAGILLIGPIGTNFSETLIKIHVISFKKMHLKMSGKWRPFSLGIGVLLLFVQRKLGVVIMTSLLSLVAPEVVIMTTSGAISDGKLGIMTTLCLAVSFLHTSKSLPPLYIDVT